MFQQNSGVVYGARALNGTERHSTSAHPEFKQMKPIARKSIARDKGNLMGRTLARSGHLASLRRKVMVLLAAGLVTGVSADTKLARLLKGTSVTPALSGIQVAILERGKITESYAYGFAQRQDKGIEPLRIDHNIRVASISKLLVAVGVMRLVDQGQVALEQDVSTYLGWELRNPSFPDQAVTLRRLLDHTSSVRDGDRYFIAAGEGRLQDFFDPNSKYWDAGAHWSDQIREIPGSYFEYANLNFGLIAEVIERVSGQRFDQFMEDEVIAPLGMTGSFNPCTLPRDQRGAGFRKRNADGEWNPEGSWYAQVDGENVSCFYGMAALEAPDQFLTRYSLGSNASLFSPQGGYRGSVIDLSALLKLLSNNGQVDGAPYLTSKSVSKMLKPSWSLNARRDNGVSAGEAEPGSPFDGLMTSYGLSVHRVDPRAWGFSDAPELLVGHLGEAYGVLSHALMDPQTGNGIATIITGTANDPAAFPGHSPLYRVEESVIQWWLNRRADNVTR